MEYKIADYFVPRAPLSFTGGWMENRMMLRQALQEFVMPPHGQVQVISPARLLQSTPSFLVN